jgi:5-bromo-4-chloroindolyl phosphate hydrolysis protein
MSFLTFKGINWNDTSSNVFFFGSCFFYLMLMMWIVVDICRRRKEPLLENIDIDNSSSTNDVSMPQSTYTEL